MVELVLVLGLVYEAVKPAEALEKTVLTVEAGIGNLVY